MAGNEPTFDEVKADLRAVRARVILDASGEPLQRLRTDPQRAPRPGWRWRMCRPPCARRWCSARTGGFTSTAAWTGGRSPAAAWGNLWNTRTRGASTLTHAAGRACWPEDLRLRRAGGRSVPQKLGPGRHGDPAGDPLAQGPDPGKLPEPRAVSRRDRGHRRARRTLFGKAAHGLDAREAAVAAALVRAPNAEPARVASGPAACCRRCPAPATPPAPSRRRPRRCRPRPRARPPPIATGWTCSSPARCSGAPGRPARASRRIWRAACWPPAGPSRHGR
jgi:penicillin-binding protein 1C